MASFPILACSGSSYLKIGIDHYGYLFRIYAKKNMEMRLKTKLVTQ